MVFTTHIFLFYFLPAVLLIYYSLPFKWRNLFLTLVSYIFYGWWEPWFVILMMISTVVDYFCGKTISAPGASRARRLGALLTAIICDMGLLAFFKYYAFTAENLNRLLQAFGSDLLPVLQDHPSNRHLLLYVRKHELYDRRVSGGCQACQVVLGSVLFHQPFSSSRCRPHRPLQCHCRATCFAGTFLGEILLRSSALHCGICQENPVGQSYGQCS